MHDRIPEALGIAKLHNLKVIGVNDPPSLEILVPYTGQEFLNGEAIRLTALSEDEEGEHLSIVWRWRHADSPNEQWTSIDTGTEVFWTEPPHGKILVRVEASDSASTVSDEVVLDVEAPPPDDEGGMGSVAIALVVIIALVVLLLLTRGRLWNVTKKPALPPETAGEDHEDEWEDLPDEEDSYTPWLR